MPADSYGQVNICAYNNQIEGMGCQQISERFITADNMDGDIPDVPLPFTRMGV
ncbi:hypothetical protein D3C75_719010 [compost metagenome]